MNNRSYIYPLKLSCYPKETIWGGDRLSKRYGKCDLTDLGESWELTVRKKEQNIIQNGECKGMSLNEYIDRFTSLSSETFPILIKFIDAHDDLSVQVHPNDEVARHNGERNGKSEMWYVIEADKGASIIYGTTDGETDFSVKAAIKKRRTSDVLKRINVAVGDTYFIPGGLVHAIGKGIVLAEIQQNSDTTYRLYDYDRKDKNGNQRELHIAQATQSLILFSEKDINDIRYSKPCPLEGNVLASCEFFSVTKLSISGIKKLYTDTSPFISLLCIEGEGKIKWESQEEAMLSGDSFFIPPELSSFELEGQLTVIMTTI